MTSKEEISKYASFCAKNIFVDDDYLYSEDQVIEDAANNGKSSIISKNLADGVIARVYIKKCFQAYLDDLNMIYKYDISKLPLDEIPDILRVNAYNLSKSRKNINLEINSFIYFYMEEHYITNEVCNRVDQLFNRLIAYGPASITEDMLSSHLTESMQQTYNCLYEYFLKCSPHNKSVPKSSFLNIALQGLRNFICDINGKLPKNDNEYQIIENLIESYELGVLNSNLYMIDKILDVNIHSNTNSNKIEEHISACRRQHEFLCISITENNPLSLIITDSSLKAKLSEAICFIISFSKEECILTKTNLAFIMIKKLQREYMLKLLPFFLNSIIHQHKTTPIEKYAKNSSGINEDFKYRIYNIRISLISALTRLIPYLNKEFLLKILKMRLDHIREHIENVVTNLKDIEGYLDQDEIPYTPKALFFAFHNDLSIGVTEQMKDNSKSVLIREYSSKALKISHDYIDRYPSLLKYDEQTKEMAQNLQSCDLHLTPHILNKI